MSDRLRRFWYAWRLRGSWHDGRRLLAEVPCGCGQRARVVYVSSSHVGIVCDDAECPRQGAPWCGCGLAPCGRQDSLGGPCMISHVQELPRWGRLVDWVRRLPAMVGCLVVGHRWGTICRDARTLRCVRCGRLAKAWPGSLEAL